MGSSTCGCTPPAVHDGKRYSRQIVRKRGQQQVLRSLLKLSAISTSIAVQQERLNAS
jgi:hypothetical protein